MLKSFFFSSRVFFFVAICANVPLFSPFSRSRRGVLRAFSSQGSFSCRLKDFFLWLFSPFIVTRKTSGVYRTPRHVFLQWVETAGKVVVFFFPPPYESDRRSRSTVISAALRLLFRSFCSGESLLVASILFSLLFFFSPIIHLLSRCQHEKDPPISHVLSPSLSRFRRYDLRESLTMPSLFSRPSFRTPNAPQGRGFPLYPHFSSSLPSIFCSLAAPPSSADEHYHTSTARHNPSTSFFFSLVPFPTSQNPTTPILPPAIAHRALFSSCRTA